MKVPLLDLQAQLQSFKNELKDTVGEIIDSGRFIMGPQVAELEKRIAEYSGADYGIGVSSGTDALLVSLMALETGPGDIVITTPYSFFATAGVVSRLNAKPVFVEIESDTYNISSEALKKWFEKAGKDAKKVKAVIPVHLYGQCADMDKILDICNSYGVPVIEDAAQAIGATYPSAGSVKKAGSMGLFGCFSFFPSKNLGGIGDGGMVVTSDKEMAEKLVKLRNHGAYPKYYHALTGGNFRLDTIQAAALLVKLPRLEMWNSERRANAANYDGLFESSSIKTPALAYGSRQHHIYNQYVISVPSKRDELREFLKDRDIGHDVYYPVPFHLQECFEYLNYRRGDFPASEYAADHTVALPVYPELTLEMQEYVADSIKEFYG